MHGYDPRYTDTHGIFYAMGPSFNRNQKVDSFENIHVYPIICKILGIPEHDNIDGDIFIFFIDNYYTSINICFFFELIFTKYLVYLCCYLTLEWKRQHPHYRITH